jgi:lysyl-tRNA synthetase class I
MKDAKQSTKDKSHKWKKDKLEKAQSFATATAKAVSASASKKNDSDNDKFDKHDFMNAFIKSYDKSQKKSSGKGKIKCSDSDSDNDSSDSDSNYSNSYKLVALKPKHSKIGIPTTEVIGETNANG